MTIMKHMALAWTFVAALAAQGQGAQDPKGELAAVIAVEEQERDLGKAETMYRELLAGTKLSVEARGLANQRFGRMLKKLGRDKEATAFLQAAKGAVATLDDVTEGMQQQDVEREKALREKARELVQQILKQQSQNWEGPLPGIADSRLAEQLLWIGEAAVPEVIAALQAELQPTGSSNVERGWTPPRLLAVQGLAGFLWRTGGTLSAAYLISCAKDQDIGDRTAIVSAAFQAEQPAMLAEAARFLNDPDDGVVRTLLESGDRQGGRQLGRRFEPQQIVDAALRGPQPGKIRMLGWASRFSQFDGPTLTKLHGLVREGLQSTDPEFGNASNQFLLSTASQTSIEGLLLLLQELPKMKGQNSVPNSLPQPAPQMQGRTGADGRFTAEQAATLLPALDACARTLGAASEDAGSRRRQWLQQLMWQVAAACDASVVPTVLKWMDLGYNVWYALAGRITTANSKDVFARFDRIAEREQAQLLELLAQVDLPADLFPLLRAKADAMARERPWAGPGPNTLGAFLAAMAKTGNADAAEWIVAAKQHVPHPNHLVGPLLDLARRARADNVRAALRSATEIDGMSLDQRGQLLLALLAMHDDSALDVVVKQAPYPITAWQPLAAKEKPFNGSPLQYLLYQDPDPPHGFTDDQVIGVLRKIAANGIPQSWEPRFWSHPAIPDRMLGELARLCARVWPRNHDQRSANANWVSLVLERIRGGSKDLGGWIATMLRDEPASARILVLEQLDKGEIEQQRALVDACLDSDDEQCALTAAQALAKHDLLTDLPRLLASRHVEVRSFAIEQAARRGSDADRLVIPMTKDREAAVRIAAAQCLGAIVSKEAVPELIALLRDSDERVRTAASDALTRIRFYHEQQAHWDRVLKGLDASAASAAEKLLLQAKPDAPKAQRLLAIQSLGTLGAPEALPFLIDWTTDTDAEIAAAAKVAITQIHLNPRR